MPVSRNTTEEVEALRRMAQRMREDGREATAILLDNAAFIAEGGSMEEYEWAKGLPDANRPS